MGSALDSKALDFIKKGPSTPEETKATVEPAKPVEKTEPSPPAKPVTIPEPEPVAPEPEQVPPAAQRETPPAPLRQEDEPLVNVNYRVPTSIARAILKASMERKLDRIMPHTQQDIATAALTAWLKKNKYL
ncbi:hypothetical protein V2O64_24775 (plasmid) [Verrucomicrobiaceae bacterium 227]